MSGPTPLAAAVIAALALTTSALAQEFTDERAAMIDTIEEHARLAPGAIEDGQLDPAVLQAMREIPRHEFVPEDVRA